MPCGSTVLVVEGEADRAAVPALVRRVLADHALYDHVVLPHPLRSKDIPSLRRAGELERFVSYACAREEGDSVLVLLDCDDDCARDTAWEFAARVEGIAAVSQRKVGVGFFCREFEALFLASMDSLAAAYNTFAWNVAAANAIADVEVYRGAKGKLQQLVSGMSYKETRDQVRFVSAVDLAVLRARSRSFRHLERLIGWLREDGEGWVYPVPP